MTITGRLSTAAATAEAPHTSDAALIHLIAAGDRNAMRPLFSRGTTFYRFLLRLVADRSTAEDLVGEVFLDVWRRAAVFQARSRVSTWLLAIARNKAMSALRRRSIEGLDEHAAAAAAIEDPGNNPEAAIQKRQQTDILLKCLTRLTSNHREVIDLVYYHEKSIDEVAEITGVSPNTVKTGMFYARKRIAELMSARDITRAAL